MHNDHRPRPSHQRSPRASAFSEPVPAAPTEPRRIMACAEFCNVLRRAGYSTTQAQSVVRGLPDPIDFDDGAGLLRRGVSLDRLIDAVGGSP